MVETKLEIKPTIGSVLRIEREDQKRTIEDVVEFTRIRSIFLEAIEKDDFDSLPSGIYKRLYVKSYADYLGINVDKYLEEIGGGPIVHKPVVKNEERVSSFEPANAVIWISLLVLVVIIGVAVTQMGDDDEPKQHIVVQEPAAEVIVETSPEQEILDVISTLKKEVSVVALEDSTLLLVDATGDVVLEVAMKISDTVFLPMEKDLVLKAESLTPFEFYVDGHFVHSLDNLKVVEGGFALSVEKLAANIDMSSLQHKFDNENATDVKAAFDEVVAKHAGDSDLDEISPEAGSEEVLGDGSLGTELQNTINELEPVQNSELDDTIAEGP